MDIFQLDLTSQPREFSRYLTFCPKYVKYQVLNSFSHVTIICRNSVKIEFWRLRDAQGKPPGVIGWWPSRSHWNFEELIGFV